MTRKHFEAIAHAVFMARNSLDCDPACIDGINAVAENLATELANHNSAFDRKRFLTACGV